MKLTTTHEVSLNYQEVQSLFFNKKTANGFAETFRTTCRRVKSRHTYWSWDRRLITNSRGIRFVKILDDHKESKAFD